MPGILLQIVLWYLLVSIAGLACWPLCSAVFRPFGDRAYGVSKALGFFCFAYLVWIVSSCPMVSLDTAAFAVFLLFSGVAWLVLRGAVRRGLSRSALRGVLTVEALCLTTFAAFLIIRAFQPEIFWGEKPMDFTFLNYFIRLERMPAREPWAAGSSLHYYYFGYFAFALLHRLFGTDSAYGYNLACAMIPALVASASFSISLALVRRRTAAVLAALLVVFAANLEVVNLWLWQQKELGFDLYWASTRLYYSPGITEYPLWAFLFADLHPHVMALPLMVVFAGILLPLWSRALTFRRMALLAVADGFVLGLFMILNTWDFVSACFVLGVSTGISLLSRRRAWCEYAYAGGFVVLSIALAFAFTFPAYLPGGALRTGRSIYPVLNRDGLTDATQMLRHLGVFFGLGALLMLSRLRRPVWRSGALAVALLAAALASGTLLYRFDISAISWDLLAVVGVFAAFVCAVGFGRGSGVPLRYASVCMLVASSVLVLSETIVLESRMNTIFKFYQAVWIFFALGVFPFSAQLLRPLCSFRCGRFLRGLAALCLLLLAIAGAGVDILIMTVFKREAYFARPTLNGLAYLPLLDGDESALIFWIRKHIGGTPAIIEAWGPSYREFTRVSMNTGLPVMLGWDYHVMQRSVPPDEIEKRKAAIREIYDTPDADEAAALLRKYGVRYVVLGNVEFRNYSTEGLMKFGAREDLFRRVFCSGKVCLYEVVARHEEVPRQPL